MLIAINTSDFLNAFLASVSIYILCFYKTIAYNFIVFILVVINISDLIIMRYNGNKKRLYNFIYNRVIKFD